MSFTLSHYDIRLAQMFRAGAGGWHLWGHCSAKVAPSASLTRPPLKPPSISAAASQPEVPKLKKKKKKKAHGLSHFLQSAYDRSLYHSINPLAWRAQRQVEKTGSWRGRRTITQVGMTSPWAGYKAVRTNTQSLEEHLKSFGVKDGLRSLLCLTADWLLLAVPESPKEHTRLVKMNLSYLVACGLMVTLLSVRMGAKPLSQSQQKVSRSHL